MSILAGVAGAGLFLLAVAVIGQLAQLVQQLKTVNANLLWLARSTALSVAIAERNANTSQRMADVVCRQQPPSSAAASGVVRH